MLPSLEEIQHRAHTNARAHLATRGLDLGSLRELLRPAADDETTLVLTASTTEGLANAESDLDVLALGVASFAGQILVHEEAFDTSVTRAGHHELNVEARSVDNLKALARRIGSTIDCIHDIDRARRGDALEFDLVRNEDLRLLHRMRWGVPLQETSGFRDWVHELRVDDLPLYLATVSLFDHFAQREDVISHVEGPEATCLRMLQLATDSLAGAVLATCGQTNPAPKWRPALLARSREQLGDEAVDRLGELLFVHPDGSEPRETVEAALAFADGLIVNVVIAAFPQMLTALTELDKVFEMPKQLT